MTWIAELLHLYIQNEFKNYLHNAISNLLAYTWRLFYLNLYNTRFNIILLHPYSSCSVWSDVNVSISDMRSIYQILDKDVKAKGHAHFN